MPRSYPIHPLAEIPPMLSEEELQDLADDIRIYGQRFPITLAKWNDGTRVRKVVADGRGRQKACEIAGVEPKYEELPDGVDVEAFIYSCTQYRRNMTTGQRAMVAAIMFPDGIGGRSGQRSDPALSSFAQNSSTSNSFYQALRLARQILNICQELPEDNQYHSYPDQVKNAKILLRTAHKKIMDNFRNEARDVTRLRQIRALYPELIEQLDRDELTLAQAEIEVVAIQAKYTFIETNQDYTEIVERLRNDEITLDEAKEEVRVIIEEQEQAAVAEEQTHRDPREDEDGIVPVELTPPLESLRDPGPNFTQVESDCERMAEQAKQKAIDCIALWNTMEGRAADFLQDLMIDSALRSHQAWLDVVNHIRQERGGDERGRLGVVAGTDTN